MIKIFCEICRRLCGYKIFKINLRPLRFMRFLKKKVALAFKRAQEQKDLQTASQTSPSSTPSTPTIISQKPFRIIRNVNHIVSPKKKRSKASESIVSKNVIKNYGKAMAAFACSKLSKPYLEDLARKEGITPADFIHYVATYKECTDSIGGLRSLLLVTENDAEETCVYKRVFQALCEIFLKYFSVNWIFSGKMNNKLLHLNLRFKMLRRVQNPEYFTYLTSKIN